MLRSNRMLQKEQTDLFAVERKLVDLLPKIHEALNSLKVEELHLKSQATAAQGTSPCNSFNVNGRSAVTPNDQINRQQIDLGLSNVNMLEQFEEIDSD
ncbi:hypothetical protein KR044_000808 [Drosophila immigrans]|nr:hypothetical protein KR044_000808 [Drosophila immigrans]